MKLLCSQIGSFLLVICIMSSCSSSNLDENPISPTPEISALIAKINDNPSKTHLDDTPAVAELAKIGLPALKGGVLELLLSQDALTRLHAKAVLELITYKMFSFVPGRGFTDPKREDEWLVLWKKNGSYNWQKSERSRRDSYIKWKKWVLEQDKMTSKDAVP